MGYCAPDNEIELLARIADGDEEAFRKVYDHYRKRIFSFSLHLTESSLLADEIVQEVFLKLWLYRKKLPEVQYFSTWLHTIAKNCVFDSLKRMARECTAKSALSDGTVTSANSVEEILLAKENEKLLGQAISKLSSQQQIIYKLSRQHGLKYNEIADRLNISPNTVKVHIANARKIISKYLHAHSDFGLLLVFLFGVH